MANRHNWNGNGGFKKQDGSKVVFFYGFPLTTTEEVFRNEILAPHSDVEVLKMDFFAKKLMSFVHCKTNEGAKSLITAWNKQMMSGSDKPLQVRFKTADRNNQNSNNQSYGGGGGGGRGGAWGGNGGHGGQDPEEMKREKIWNSIQLPGEPKHTGSRPFNPKSVEDETHTKLGYAKEALKITGFEPDMSQTQVIDILSVFGPIHTFYEVAEGEFIVRFCYDLCTEFVHKHLVEQAESGSPLVKTQKIPENLQMERIDTLEEWV